MFLTSPDETWFCYDTNKESVGRCSLSIVNIEAKRFQNFHQAVTFAASA